MEDSINEIITFDYIREAYLAEKSENKLSKLPKDFFAKVNSYLKLKEEIYNNTKDEKVRYELKTAKKIVDEILLLRLKKIIDAVFIFLKSGSLPENLLKEEEMFFFSLIEQVKSLRKNLLEQNLVIEKTEESKQKEDLEKKEEAKEKNVIKIKFLFDVPEFVAPDGKLLGPFKKGEIREIDIEIGKIFIENGFAIESR
ncbi:MAG: hypothetical protein QW197_02505 [Candidatus Aenigmatarchaeota archaeon]